MVNRNKDLVPLMHNDTEFTLYGFDIETYSKKNYFYMGSIVGKDYERVFYEKYDMIKELLKLGSGENVRLVATNLQFDLFGLFQDTHYLPNIEPIIRGARIIGAKYKKSSKYIWFLDTNSFYPAPLSRLGEIIGLPKMDPPSFLGQKPRNNIQDLELKRYNIHDSTITYRFIDLLQRFYLASNTKMKMTSASSSFDCWRRNYQLRTYYALTPMELQCCLDGYYGGRTEAYKRGSFNNAKCFDINSLYPYVMYEYPMPDPNNAKMVFDPKISHIEQAEGISFVRVYCPNDVFPLLPLRFDDKLLFPTGIFEGWYTHFELRKAVDLGYKILNIYVGYHTRNYVTPFKEFVQDHYTKRKEYKEQGSIMEQFVKLNMNSLYGRFGMKPYERIVRHADSLTIEEIEEYEGKGYECSTVGESCEWYYFQNKEIIEENITGAYQPLWASHITAYARWELYKLQIEAGDSLLYSDTDSIFIENKEMPVSKELGGLSCDAVIDEGIIVRPKMYAYKKENGTYSIKCKGVSGMNKYDKTTDPTNHHNYDLFKESITYNTPIPQQRFMSFSGAQRIFKGSWRRINEIVELEKYLSVEDAKRNWLGKRFDIDDIQKSIPWCIILVQRGKDVYHCIEIEKNNIKNWSLQNF